MTIKLALIGCGYWGKNYVRTLEHMPNTSIKYVYDANQPSISLPEGMIFTQNIDDILNDSEVKGVVIAIPTTKIFGITKKCLEAGKDVLMEKPMTDSSDKALQLIKLAEEKNLVLMVGHIFLYHPAIRKLKELIDSGELGKILHIYSARIAPGPVRNTDEVNVLWDLAPHDISIFMYLLGKKPSLIKGFSNSFLRANITDSVSFSIAFGYTIAEAHVRWWDAEKMRRLTVIGDKKIAVFDDLNSTKLKIYNKYVDFKDKASIIDNGVVAPALEDITPLEKQCQDFLECIESRKKPVADGENGFSVVRILEDIEKNL